MKGITDASPEKQQDKEKRELERLKCEQARPKGSGYMIYFIMIITVIYIADEVTSQIGTQMQTILADQIFAPVFGAEYAVARMSTLGMITVVFGILAFLYKPLSDRFGRKIFLVINTLGMGLGMVLVGIATNIPVYLIGACVIGFFIPHDMQATYLLSTPHVTTVQQPVYRIGEMLAEQLLKELDGKSGHINKLVKPDLIEGKSVSTISLD